MTWPLFRGRTKVMSTEFYTNYGFTKPLPTEQPVIAYCRLGKRANVAAKVLIKQFGFPTYMSVQLLELLASSSL